MPKNDAAKLAQEKIDVPWDDLRAARVQTAVLKDLREGSTADLSQRTIAKKSRTFSRWMAFAAVALVSFAALVFYIHFHHDPQRPTLELADGSFVIADADARVAVEKVLPELIELRQTGGSAVYEVTPHPERRFLVWNGDLRVEVLGTGFRIEQLTSAVRVTVTHGRVHVTRGKRDVILLTGEQVVLGDQESSDPVPSASASASAPVVESAAPSGSGALPHPRPSASASEAVSPEATTSNTNTAPSASSQAESSQAMPSTAEPNAGELFRRADEARKQGSLDEAVRLLRELVTKFPHDGRATLAVFTIGRVEEQRQDYAAAATAFESCGAALSGEALAEAAMARAAIGQNDRARALAQQYLDHFPDGPRKKELARFLE